MKGINQDEKSQKNKNNQRKREKKIWICTNDISQHWAMSWVMTE